jgi:hypothetical protein
MYSKKNNLILGFHGCRKEILKDILDQSIQMKPSNNDYDWLGSGMYFWENDLNRAQKWAEDKYKEEAAVIGAVLNLGKCLDFLDSTNLVLLEPAYERFKQSFDSAGYTQMPENSSLKDGCPLNRKLDCAIINLIIQDAIRQQAAFDSVRGVFWEGKEPYPSAGFKEANHIQINIINPNCIKGFFLPRKLQNINFAS